MIACKLTQCTNFFGRRKRTVRFGKLGAIACWLCVTLTWGTASLAQSPSPTPSHLSPEQQIFQFGIPGLNQMFTDETAHIVTKAVRLDGRKLYTIAASEVKEANSSGESSDSVRLRAEEIEERLRTLANTDFDPDTLTVTVGEDPNNQQQVVSVTYRMGEQEKTQRVMTVTDLDAQIHGTDAKTWAKELTQTLQAALVQARQERQPQYVQQQGLLGGGIFLAIGLASFALARLQKRILRQGERLDVKAAQEAETLAQAINDPAATVNTTILQNQREIRQKQRLNDIQYRLLQLLQLTLWGIGLFFLLGLLPYSRWLQPAILRWLEIPVRLLGVFFGTYILVRLSEVLVDRFFGVLQDGAHLAPEVTQRVALRFFTFARVVKSVLTLLIIGSGVIVALSLLGVRVAPLLAGAGIIGLGISFASQSLIKDMINGFLILLEDQYGVGDVISVGNVSGLVENMNLRITQLRSADGSLITVPNSSIAIVQNLSKEWSRVDLTIDVAYEADIDRAMTVIQQVATEMSRDRQWRDLILDPPTVLGIDKMDNAGIMVRVWIKTQPLKQWEVSREFRRRLKLALDKAEIPIGGPQQPVLVSNVSSLEDELQQLTKVVADTKSVSPPPKAEEHKSS
jgi:small conductance mechanosensitive channel